MASIDLSTMPLQYYDSDEESSPLSPPSQSQGNNCLLLHVVPYHYHQSPLLYQLTTNVHRLRNSNLYPQSFHLHRPRNLHLQPLPSPPHPRNPWLHHTIFILRRHTTPLHHLTTPYPLILRMFPFLLPHLLNLSVLLHPRWRNPTSLLFLYQFLTVLAPFPHLPPSLRLALILCLIQDNPLLHQNLPLLNPLLHHLLFPLIS